MAVARCSSDFSTFITTQTEDSNGSVTVPADCTSGNNGIGIVVASGYTGSNLQLFTELCWDGGSTMDFSHIISSLYSGDDSTVSAYYMVASDGNWPGSGSKTLYWNTPATITEGYTIGAIFYIGVDLGDPIRDSEGVAVEQDSDWTSSLVGVTGDDYTVGLGYDYAQIPDADPGGYNQTAIRESLENSAGYGLGDELGEDAFRLEHGGGGVLVPLAFALQVAAVGGLSIPIAMHHYKQLMGAN